jgi:hypothetical protein
LQNLVIMSVPDFLITFCFISLMVLGAYVLVVSIKNFTNKDTPSHISLPGLKIELKGPAWLVSALLGAIMLSSPVIAAAFQGSDNITTAPPSVKNVLDIAKPNYNNLKFARDLSILDLRSIMDEPWYVKIPGWKSISNEKMNPGVLTNYMIVRKVREVEMIKLVYSTSKKLDIKCISHNAEYRYANTVKHGVSTETWEVSIDISGIPLEQEFEVIVEATYWGGFAGNEGDNYTTYAHSQEEVEDISIILLLPKEKPFKKIMVTEFSPVTKEESLLKVSPKELFGSTNLTYYLNLKSKRPNWFYKVAWTW